MNIKYLFISIVFFPTFVGYRLPILGVFQTLGKNSICMVSHLNGITDTLYICWVEDFTKKIIKNNLFISIVFLKIYVGYRLRIFGF
jgi:hypothetical protein